MPRSSPESKPKKVTRRLKKALHPFFYIIRACRPDYTSNGAFKYPASGPVKASNYRHTAECGWGLHGWPHPKLIGHSTPSWYDHLVCSSRESTVLGPVYLLIRVPRTHQRRPNYIKIGREKLKFNYGEVVLNGSKETIVRAFNELVLPLGLTVDGHRQ